MSHLNDIICLNEIKYSIQKSSESLVLPLKNYVFIANHGVAVYFLSCIIFVSFRAFKFNFRK